MKFIIVFLAISITACTDSNGTRSVLQSNGMTDISITGYQFFGCSKEDIVRTGFKATSISGQKVEGVVCSGILFKNSTIRYK